MAERVSICGRCHETSSSAGAGLDGLALAVGLHWRVEEVVPTSAGMRWTLPDADGEETRMDSNYVFLCALMWCRFGQQDAGKELTQGCRFRGSRYESTGLGDGERGPSLERVGKMDATSFPHDP